MNQSQCILNVECGEIEKSRNSIEIVSDSCLVRSAGETDADYCCTRETGVFLPCRDRNACQQLVLAENDIRRDLLRRFDCAFNPDDRLGGYSVLAEKPRDMLRNELVPTHAKGAKP